METMERDAKYIADQCRYIRKMFGLTQENLADAAGLTVRTIQKVESGRHMPEVQTLRSLARGLGFDMAVFLRPTPEQEKLRQEEMERALRKTALVPTSPIKKPNDFYSRNREWDGILINTSAVEADHALELTASISDWMTDLDGIWDISTASQRLEYATSIADLCRELEGLGYLTHFGHFRQQHMKDKGMILDVGLITFLPKAEHDGDRYGIVNLEDPWEVPEQDRPRV
ncbi:helix-turn-helix domain-containing protein [Rhodobacter ferrooxidans]|uniref:Transcriptional regulator, XRE family n=1 Tax=Rhodobacter ferrooxidans TaxID=371731 RepID=C8S200_9RHOB|nr:helix-turn-helix transcriptional regulator [Rhodobacter sp. SW2]EEW25098.1 transcriptional regulator, XRE family [Rhodobacter sp. SW2]